ncbi:hypothetical protein Csa_022457 [Cucumis sativus]|uniref:Retrotransposon Copia-like N-terminal domain-containing protein n=1 Tax=Cucumis sativus TaxID=3659 RepID=A0A0A0LSF9_CUCSA|nr:hypothetical protein Csa_022457 [Cucumis sativus]
MPTSSSQSDSISTETPTNLIPTKSTYSTNYLIWKYQVSSILKEHSLFGHIDDSLPCPFNFFPSTPAGTTPEINLEHLQWLSRDQAHISLINTTPFPSTLAHVVGTTSSKALWFSPEKRHSSNTISNILDL